MQSEPSTTELLPHSQKMSQEAPGNPGAPAGIPPHRKKKSAHAPITLDQRFSSRPTVPPEDIWSFQETFLFATTGEGIHN